jgi:hypothetical protein
MFFLPSVAQPIHNCAEHVEKQATGCTSGVDVLIQHLEIDLLAFEISGNLAQMKRGIFA